MDSVRVNGARVSPTPTDRGHGAGRFSSQRYSAALAVAASLLLVVSAAALWTPAWDSPALSRKFLRLVLSGPAVPQAGAINRYSLLASQVTGKPVEADVRCVLSSPQNDTLWTSNAATAANGRLDLDVPANVPLATGARLGVFVCCSDTEACLETRLAVSAPRRVTQLALDKPLYQPGETVFYRSLTLKRASLRCDEDLPVQYEIHDAGGAVVDGSQSSQVTELGVGAGAFMLPADCAGGEYAVVARSPDQTFPEEKRKFYVRHYRAPRFKKELEFTRDSYSPGDQVQADVSAISVEGGAPPAAQMTATATVDGAVVYQAAVSPAASGASRVEFALPQIVQRGLAQLAVTVDDGGTAETIAKEIPINLGQVNVQFFPEGGDLVAGLENRVYFSARDSLDAPLHVEGDVLDAQGRRVAELKTQHEGMGAFRFQPVADQTYRVKLRQPAAVNQQPTLPPTPRDRTARLSTGEGVFAAGQPLQATVDVLASPRPLLLAAVCRGAQVGQSLVPPGSGPQQVGIPLNAEVGGVIRLTLYDYSQLPPRAIAERLVYRRPQRRLQVKLAEHARRYAPGDKVRLALQVTDEHRRPAPAMLSVSVVDDAVLSLAGDKTPSLATHFLLASQLDHPSQLEEADFYLEDGPQAAQALDLLLGTQGWRKFAEPAAGDPPPLLAGIQDQDGDHDGVQDPTYRELDFAELSTPPAAVLDNLNQIQPQYDRALSASRSDRAHRMGMVAFFGSLLLLLGMLLLGLSHALGSPLQWAPIGVVAAASLALSVAGLRSNPAEGLLTPGSRTPQLAFQSFSLEPPAAMLAYAEANGNWDTSSGPYLYFNDSANMFGAMGAGDLSLNRRKFTPLVVKEGFAGAGYAPRFGNVPWYFAWEDTLVRGRFGNGSGMAEDRFGDDWRDNGVLFGRHGELDADDVPILYPTPEVWRLLTQRTRRWRRLMELEQLQKHQLQELGQVRQYAHQHVRRQAGVRDDFAETLYWNPMLVADARGHASLEFDLSDSVTTFRVSADAHSTDGRLGSGGGELLAAMPFHMEPKLPLEVTAGDRVDVALAVSNGAAVDLPVRVLMTTNWTVLGSEALGVAASDLSAASAPSSGDPASAATVNSFDAPPEDAAAVDFESQNQLGGSGQRAAARELVLAAGERSRMLFELVVPDAPGRAMLAFRGEAGDQSDAVERPLRVSSDGFPVQMSYGGKLSGPQELNVSLPDDFVPGSLEVTLHAYPSVLADLQNGLKGMLREPTGCFEQASSGNYPNVLALQFMQESQMADPELTRQARDLLTQGYARLTGFECPTHGFEWFGGDPGHEALTAYGLLQFHDMAQVHKVDPALLTRTESWLEQRRDGQGGFRRKDQAMGGFGAASRPITDAYIVWALSEAGQKNLDVELDRVQQLARDSADPYLLALVAASTAAAQSHDRAIPFLDKLAAAQADDGHLEGLDGSITRSGGLSLQVETTALAALAWLKLPQYRSPAQRAIDWLIAQRRGTGDFGSTQATVLALKALVSFARVERSQVSAGELIVERDGQIIGQHTIAAGELKTVTVAGLEGQLQAGDNQLQVTLTGQDAMPYGLDVRYQSRQPQSDQRCPLRLSTRLDRTRVRAGQTVRLLAEVENIRDEGQPMTVAILGLPAGLEPQPEQLERLRKSGAVDFYETRAREIICYWRSLAPHRKVDIALDLVSEIPGEFTGPASRVYLYYTSEQKQWAPPLKARIDPIP